MKISVDIVKPEKVDAQLQQQQIEFFRNSGGIAPFCVEP